MDHGNVQFVTMNQNSKPERLSTWRLGTWSRRDTIVPSARSSVPHIMHLNFTNPDTIDNSYDKQATCTPLNCFKSFFLWFPEKEIMSRMLKSDGQWTCTVCSYSSVLKHNVLKHVEAKHVATSGYNCGICQKFCSSLNALKLHESRYHRRQQYWP